MKTSEFRKHVDALARFAVSREKATAPESRIGVQEANGSLKLISGTQEGGMVVTLPSQKEGTSVFAIDARPFLQAAKVIPTKEEVTLETEKDKLHIRLGGGGVLTMNSVSTIQDAGFVRKPRQPAAIAVVSGESFARIAKMFTEISAKVEVPSIQVVQDKAYATTVSPGNRPRYATVCLPLLSGDDGYTASAYLDFWSALRGLSEDGQIAFGKDGVTATSGSHECYSGPYLTSRMKDGEPTLPAEPPAWPILKFKSSGGVAFEIERKRLIEAVRGQVTSDGRITIAVDETNVMVSSYGNEEGFRLPLSTQGRGNRSMSAEYLLGILGAMDSKEVTLRWGSPAPAISIEAKEYGTWQILLAPTAL